MNSRKLSRFALAICLVLLSTFAGISWYVGGQLVAPANRLVGPPPSEAGIQSVEILSKSGSPLSAWYIPNQTAEATVILLHPIRADRRPMLGRSALLHNAGCATLLVDLQAHGESPGDQITAGYRERLDVMAAVEFVRTKTPNHQIGIVGWSLGGAAALFASPLEIDALVIESVYPSVSAAIHNRISMRLGPLAYLLTPVLLVQMKPRLGIAASQMLPIDYVPDVGCPILIAAGTRDAHTTFAESIRIFDAAKEPKQFVEFKGAGHQDLLKNDPGRYGEVIDFLLAHLSGKPPPEKSVDGVGQAADQPDESHSVDAVDASRIDQ
ncbi:MAG: alpha/beta fold hydrolase [Planctomycetota bacterium]|nr:alpha/beta fold hydrolase [Planctomycetota bacterium]